MACKCCCPTDCEAWPYTNIYPIAPQTKCWCNGTCCQPGEYCQSGVCISCSGPCGSGCPELYNCCCCNGVCGPCPPCTASNVCPFTSATVSRNGDSALLNMQTMHACVGGADSRCVFLRYGKWSPRGECGYVIIFAGSGNTAEYQSQLYASGCTESQCTLPSTLTYDGTTISFLY